MKMVKSLLLGTAAGLVAMSGAQAADLPVKAKPVQYVKICSLYGAGFYYIPGTDTCIKIGGWVRAEYNLNAGGSFSVLAQNDWNRTSPNENTIRARAMITVDTRNQTEYGTLRSYIASGWNSTSTTFAAVNANTGAITPGQTATQDALYVPRAFIQLGGFTWGKAQSFYDFYSTPAYSNTTNVWGADTGGGGDIVAAYTAQLGNGLSATISAEDPLTRRTTVTGSGGYIAGPYWPDLVANLRVDQAWGSAQVMGALHQVAAQYTTGIVAYPEDVIGWAVGAGVTVKLPMLGAGDSISAEVNYTEGALKYAGSGLGNFSATFGSTTGGGFATDAVVTGAGAGTLTLTTAWSVVGGFQHVWNKSWKTSLYGTYGEVSFDDAVAVGGAADWNFSQIGSRTVWTPVANLDLSVDVMYNMVGSAAAGFVPGVPAANTIADQSWWQGIVRVQRNFWP